ncbi:unnamed protein product [Periconia digitata]|uniref:Uncharacterized protein n=1 Tax=Periconia digitata TaxID=1303443 RepID=A0A9W4UXI0_9PLEO|nr:unnamed protein product [Periconia digitata]
MISNTVSTVILALITPTVLGNFAIYNSGIGGDGISENVDGWQIYELKDGVPACDDALDWIWRDSDDVSGLKYGVRCSGDGDSCNRSGSGDKIKELEINARQYKGDSNRLHFTYYANRGGVIVDTDDKPMGICEPAPEEQFYCGIKGGRAEGTRKLNCHSGLWAGNFTQPT